MSEYVILDVPFVLVITNIVTIILQIIILATIHLFIIVLIHCCRSSK